MIRSLSLRITLVKPPHGAPLCLQQGKDDLVPPSAASGEQVSFDFSVNMVLLQRLDEGAKSPVPTSP
jgi:hypothetical protein